MLPDLSSPGCAQPAMSLAARYFMGPLRRAATREMRPCDAMLMVDHGRWAWTSLPLYALVLYGVIVAGIVGGSIVWGLAVVVPGFLVSLLLPRFVPLRAAEDDPELPTSFPGCRLPRTITEACSNRALSHGRSCRCRRRAGGAARLQSTARVS